MVHLPSDIHFVKWDSDNNRLPEIVLKIIQLYNVNLVFFLLSKQFGNVF